MGSVSLDDLVTQVRQVAGEDPLDRVDAAVAQAGALSGHADAGDLRDLHRPRRPGPRPAGTTD